MTDMHKRASVWLMSLCALIGGACSTSANGPADAGREDDSEGDVFEPDAVSPADADASVSDAANNGGYGSEGGLSSGTDSAAPTSDGAPGTRIDASPAKDGASSDATPGDAGEKGADAGLANDGATSDATPGDAGETRTDVALSKDGAILDATLGDAGEEGTDAAVGNDDATSDAALGDGGGKQPFKGVAGSNCAELVSLNLSWWYDWETNPTGCTSTPFVPMIWGQASEQTAAAITSEVSTAVAAGYKYVLGFNEPDNSTQSSITVAKAISLWPSFNNPAVLIGSPATQGNTTGLEWIQDFMTQVNSDTTGTLRVDFIATHWYGWNAGACDPAANALESWIAGIEAIPGNRPIWLTEWGCSNQSNPNAATVQTFFAGALAMFAKHPRVVRYAWYQWITYNELIDADSGALTTLGTAYANAPAFH
jgi:hypothetical protein